MPSFTEVYNLQCKIFEPATANLSEKELNNLLMQLYEYFPFYDQGEGNKKPYDTDQDHSKKWFLAYNHLLKLLEMRRQESKYKTSLYISISAIIISIAGLLVKVYCP